MSVRVRCRCGQEVVLRYGEWVYALIGLVLLCVLFNMLALLLLYFRLEEIAGASRAAVRSEVRSEGTPAGQPAQPSRIPPAAQGGDVPSPPPAPLPAGSGAARPGGAERTGTSAGSKAGDPLGAAPAPGSAAPGARSAQKKLIAIDGAPGALLLQGRRAGAVVSGASASLPAAAGAPSIPSPDWIDPVPLLRFLALERSGGGTLLPAALLGDPDPRIRRRAMARCLSGPIPPCGGGASDAVCLLIRRASPLLAEDPRGREILGAARLQDASIPDPGGPEWKAVEASIRAEVARGLASPERAVRDYLAEVGRKGLDVVILLDTSRSMEAALDGFRRESAWLFPAIGWALPGSRIGLVLYRDDVESTVDFRPGPEAFPSVGEARAEGGGDVTEGVHHALRSALSLGRFRWRPGAFRHIVVVADAPPPHAEQAGTVLLAAQAFRQGGYRTSVIAFDTRDEFRSRSPFFPGVARAGGGRSRLLEDPAQVGTEIFLCLFPADAHPTVERVAAVIRELFAA